MTKQDAIEIIKDLIDFIEKRYGCVENFYAYAGNEEEYNQVKNKFFELLER